MPASASCRFHSCGWSTFRRARNCAAKHNWPLPNTSATPLQTPRVTNRTIRFSEELSQPQPLATLAPIKAEQ